MYYDYQYSNGRFVPDAPPPVPRWLYDAVGAHYFVRVNSVYLEGQQFTDSLVRQLQGLPLTSLGLIDTKVTSHGLSELHGQRGLRWICFVNLRLSREDLAWLGKNKNIYAMKLANADVDDIGLEKLKALSQLKHLWFDGSPRVTDAGLAHLRGLSNIEVLGLMETSVSDAGLPHLRSLRKLRSLDLEGTKVSNSAAKEFQEASPTLQEFFLPTPASAK